MEKLTLNDIQVYLRKHGNKGARLLSSLGQQHALIRALDTEIGQSLLVDSVDRMDALLLKIIAEDADEKDKAEYRVLRDLTDRWSSKIMAYISNLNKVGGE